MTVWSNHRKVLRCAQDDGDTPSATGPGVRHLRPFLGRPDSVQEWMRRAVGSPAFVGLIVTAAACGVAAAAGDAGRFEEPSTREAIELAAGCPSTAFVIDVARLPLTRTRRDGS